MPFILRIIRKSKWYKSTNTSWLDRDELQADALSDFSTKDNTLSVYQIENDRSNLEQVITALAATRNTLSNFDYALLDLQLVSELGIKTTVTEGATSDPKVNSWHYDLIELTVDKLAALVKAFHEKGVKERLQHKKVRELLTRTIDEGNVDTTRVDPKLLAKIDRLAVQERKIGSIRVSLVKLPPRFDERTAPRVERLLEAVVEIASARVIANCSAVEVFDKVALTTLVVGAVMCRKLGGDLHLCGLQKGALDTLEEADLEKVFRLFINEDEAVQAFL